PEGDGITPARGSSGVDFWQHLADVQGKVTLPSDGLGHHVTEADVQKLLSGMIVSLVSKVNPPPDAPAKTSGSDPGTTAPHLPLGGGVVDPPDLLPMTHPGGTVPGPKPSVGPGVPGGPRG